METNGCHVSVFCSQVDEGYIADIPDLKHCSAFGGTPEQGLKEVLKAKDAWLDSVSGKTDSFALLPTCDLSSCLEHSSMNEEVRNEVYSPQFAVCIKNSGYPAS